MRQKIVVEMLNHAPFRCQIEIDEHVAAKDDVQALHENHARVVRQVQAAEGNAIAHDLLDLQLFSTRAEIFLAIVRGLGFGCCMCRRSRSLHERESAH